MCVWCACCCSVSPALRRIHNRSSKGGCAGAGVGREIRGRDRREGGREWKRLASFSWRPTVSKVFWLYDDGWVGLTFILLHKHKRERFLLQDDEKIKITFTATRQLAFLYTVRFLSLWFVLLFLLSYVRTRRTDSVMQRPQRRARLFFC